MNKEKLEKLLLKASIENERIILWNHALDTFSFVEYITQTIRRDRNEMVFKPAPEMNVEQVKNVITGSGKLNVFLTKSKLFLKCEFKKIDDNYVITATLPEFTLRDDRRSAERLTFDDLEVSFNMKDSLHKSNVGDISPGGLSVYYRKDAGGVPRIGDVVTNIRLSFKQIKTVIDGKVVNSIKIPPYQEIFPYTVWKLSIKFDEQIDELLEMEEQ